MHLWWELALWVHPSRYAEVVHPRCACGNRDLPCTAVDKCNAGFRDVKYGPYYYHGFPEHNARSVVTYVLWKARRRYLTFAGQARRRISILDGDMPCLLHCSLDVVPRQSL